MEYKGRSRAASIAQTDSYEKIKNAVSTAEGIDIMKYHQLIDKEPSPEVRFMMLAQFQNDMRTLKDTHEKIAKDGNLLPIMAKGALITISHKIQHAECIFRVIESEQRVKESQQSMEGAKKLLTVAIEKKVETGQDIQDEGRHLSLFKAENILANAMEIVSRQALKAFESASEHALVNVGNEPDAMTAESVEKVRQASIAAIRESHDAVTPAINKQEASLKEEHKRKGRTSRSSKRSRSTSSDKLNKSHKELNNSIHSLVGKESANTYLASSTAYNSLGDEVRNLRRRFVDDKSVSKDFETAKSKIKDLASIKENSLESGEIKNYEKDFALSARLKKEINPNENYHAGVYVPNYSEEKYSLANNGLVDKVRYSFLAMQDNQRDKQILSECGFDSEKDNIEQKKAANPDVKNAIDNNNQPARIYAQLAHTSSTEEAGLSRVKSETQKNIASDMNNVWVENKDSVRKYFEAVLNQPDSNETKEPNYPIELSNIVHQARDKIADINKDLVGFLVKKVEGRWNNIIKNTQLPEVKREMRSQWEKNEKSIAGLISNALKQTENKEGNNTLEVLKDTMKAIPEVLNQAYQKKGSVYELLEKRKMDPDAVESPLTVHKEIHDLHELKKLDEGDLLYQLSNAVQETVGSEKNLNHERSELLTEKAEEAWKETIIKDSKEAASKITDVDSNVASDYFIQKTIRERFSGSDNSKISARTEGVITGIMTSVAIAETREVTDKLWQGNSPTVANTQPGEQRSSKISPRDAPLEQTKTNENLNAGPNKNRSATGLAWTDTKKPSANNLGKSQSSEHISDSGRKADEEEKKKVWNGLMVVID